MKRMLRMLKEIGIVHRLLRGLFLMLVVFTIGVSGYVLIEDYKMLDGVYMTIITMASVGFSEVHPLSDKGKIFTSILIVLSVSAYIYAITIVTSLLVEDEFRNRLKHYRLNQNISKLKDHVIVCGYGRNGKQACQQLGIGNVSYVVIDNDTHVLEQLRDSHGVLFVEGNATEDHILENAGINRAKGLIAAMPDDAANVFVTLTARELNPKLKIISRASSNLAETKLKRAGADNVIMPDKIGGTHMAALITKPDVLEFLDFITGKIYIRLEELQYHQLAHEYRDKPIALLNVQAKSGANVIGLKKKNGDYSVNPDGNLVLTENDKLFVLGTEEQIGRLLSLVALV